MAMADGPSRKQAALFRLRAQLRKKRESLADQFDFKMFLIILFKDPVRRRDTVTDLVGCLGCWAELEVERVEY